MPPPATLSGSGVSVGVALWAMSLRNAVSMCKTSTGARTGAARLPSTNPVAVTYCGRPWGPGVKLPYGSDAIIGMLLTSRSTNCKPSLVAACFLIIAHVARPPSADDRILPVDSGTPVVESYSRRKIWCDACDEYVWLRSTYGVSVLGEFLWPFASVMVVPRVSTMKAWLAGT